MESARVLRCRAQVAKKRCCQSQPLPGNVFAFIYEDNSLEIFQKFRRQEFHKQSSSSGGKRADKWNCF